MIKLSTFMLDPVKAHESYLKELEKVSQPYLETIAKLQQKLEKKTKECAGLKHKIKEIQNKYKNAT